MKPFKEHGSKVIDYVLETDKSYIKARYIEEDKGISSKTAARVLKGLGEFYALDIKEEMGDPQVYYLEPLRNQSLEQLKTELE